MIRSNGSSGFNLLLFNPRSINNKADLFVSLLEDKNIDIAAVCETWLTSNSSVTTAIIKERGYSLHHNYRINARGGGTALIYRSNLTCSMEKSSMVFNHFELTLGKVKTGSNKILFVVMYRTGPLTSAFTQELDLLLSDISTRSDNIVLAGDLNIHFDGNNRVASDTLKILKSYGLRALYDRPTHIGGACLDQLFTFSLNDHLHCSNVFIDNSDTLGSDHFPVICNISNTLGKKYFKSIEFRDIKAVDKDTFSSDLNDVLDQFNVSETFENSVVSLDASIVNLLDVYAPLISKRVSVVDTAPWFDKEYRDLRKLRRQAEKKKNRSEGHFLHYKELCHEATTLASTKKKNFLETVIKKSENKTRTLYQVVNKVMDRKQSRILPDYTDNIELLASDFNKFFSEKVEKIRDNIPATSIPDCTDTTVTPLFEFEPTCISELEDIIKESGINCSPNDCLPHDLVKDNITSLLHVWVDLVNQSLSSGSMDGVKLADVIPLVKDESQDPNILKNYRPVSNLTFLGKLIERVVLRRLNEHLSRNNLNCQEQFAYKKHHSTETLLIKIVNDVLIAADEKTATVVMLLDLSAAFDTVDHNLLLKILRQEIGIRGSALSWFTSFLTGRCQRIRLGKSVSETIILRFGVPQGSVLGPVLFNIYIRSLYSCVKESGFSIIGYADDHQIMKSFKPSDQVKTLTNQLRNCFLKIKNWMSQYYLQLNDSKTQLIVFGPRTVLNEIELHGVEIAPNTLVMFVPTVKNLGLVMDNQLVFDKQIVNLKKKCFHTLRNIRKIRFLLNLKQVKIIVNSLVVSCLDYCNGVYFGIGEKLLHQLQLLQNAAAKAVTGKYKHDHMEDDLTNLHWLDVKKRIVFKISLLSHKSLLGLAPTYIKDMFQYAHHGHTLKLMVPSFNSKYGERSFSVVAPKIYNRLPTTITSAESLETFKAFLKTYLFKLSQHELEKLYQ